MVNPWNRLSNICLQANICVFAIWRTDAILYFILLSSRCVLCIARPRKHMPSRWNCLTIVSTRWDMCISGCAAVTILEYTFAFEVRDLFYSFVDSHILENVCHSTVALKWFAKTNRSRINEVVKWHYLARTLLVPAMVPIVCLYTFPLPTFFNDLMARSRFSGSQMANTGQ